MSTEELLIQQQQMLLELSRQIEAMQSNRVSDRPWNKEETAFFLGVHPNTLMEYVKYWQEGIHYFRLPGKTGAYRYNPELIRDWLENRNDPIAHQQAIEVWNSRRLCNQGKRRKAS